MQPRPAFKRSQSPEHPARDNNPSRGLALGIDSGAGGGTVFKRSFPLTPHKRGADMTPHPF